MSTEGIIFKLGRRVAELNAAADRHFAMAADERRRGGESSEILAIRYTERANTYLQFATEIEGWFDEGGA